METKYFFSNFKSDANIINMVTIFVTTVEAEYLELSHIPNHERITK